MSKLEFICKLDEIDEQITSWMNSSDTGTVQFGVKVDDVLFPIFLALSSSNSDRLTVFYNGAVSRERSADGIVFQRSSWKDEVPSNVISFADPTLILHETMSIGWGQLDGNLFAPEKYKKILDQLRSSLNLPSSERTLHFGSSAGGFQALATAGYDKHSRVLCNNPQIDFSQYNLAWAANRALKINGFANRHEYLNSDEHSDVSWRIEIPRLYERIRYIPKNIRILVNTASANDLNIQIASFIADITEISSTPTISGFEVYYYHHPALGHNPLPKVATVQEIITQLEKL